MSEWARVSTMRASTRRSGSIFDVAQFFVINLVIIFIYMCCFPTADARKSMPPLIDDDQHVRMNKPGEFSSVFFFFGFSSHFYWVAAESAVLFFFGLVSWHCSTNTQNLYFEQITFFCWRRKKTQTNDTSTNNNNFRWKLEHWTYVQMVNPSLGLVCDRDNNKNDNNDMTVTTGEN